MNEVQVIGLETVDPDEIKKKLNATFDAVDPTFWELMQNQEPILEIIEAKLKEAMRMLQVEEVAIDQLSEYLGYDQGGYVHDHAQLILDNLTHTQSSFGYNSLEQAVENHVQAARQRSSKHI